MMNVISTYNGISCGHVAFERAKIPIERYVAFEIDKYANQVAKANYPDDEYNGDVFDADFTQYKGFDILIGGSPCTHWSIAKNGRETTSSGIGWELFMQYKRALLESECRYFLYENNYSIHKDIQAAISRELGVQPIMINSALVSAQQRKRLYWTNISNVGQPADKGVLLHDILESGNGIIVSEQGNHIDKTADKSYCLLARDYKGFGNQAMTGVAEAIDYKAHKDSKIVVTENSIRCQRNDKKHSTIQGTHVTLPQGKSQTLQTAHIPMVFQPACMRYIRTDEAKKLRKQYESGEIKHGYHEYHMLSPRTDGKSNTLSTVLKDNPICEPIRIGNLGEEIHNKQGYRVYSVKGKSVCLSSNGSGVGGKTGLYKIDLPDGDYIIRKLTPIECERLQTLPDNYTQAVSNTQRYKGIGNGWTVDVIAHILSFIF